MLEVQHLSKSFGGVTAMDDVTLSFPSRSLTAVIGPNGAGKSTLFNLSRAACTPTGGASCFMGLTLQAYRRRRLSARGLAAPSRWRAFFRR